MRYFTALLFFQWYVASVAQTPQVPHKMHFAGMTLTIHDDARREIQEDVDALTRSPRHFNIKVERARTYFPIIEKIFAEERLPDDFKYLVLQESALIPDAVSVSDAVGFWQFKDFTAAEMGLRVDKEIDERMNIVSSTRAAARYLKKNNFYFNNWLYALQAYQMGAGGVMKSVKNSQSGARHMDINGKTYWYVKKYLAHKVAFETAVEGPGEIQVNLYQNNSKRTLKELAREVAVEEEQLLAYNKWIRKDRIPDDKVYAVALPAPGNAAGRDTPLASAAPVAAGAPVRETAARKNAGERKKINGVWALRAQPGEDPAALAARAGVDVSYFLKCNEINVSTPLNTDTWYFTAKKRARAEQAYHKVTAGESLWEISQQYGVRQKKLLRFNRIKSGGEIKPGMTLWLSARKPAGRDKQVAPSEIIEVDRTEVFSWEATPGTAPVSEAGIRQEEQHAIKDNVKQGGTTEPERAPAVSSSQPAAEEAPSVAVKDPEAEAATARQPVQKADSVVAVSVPAAKPEKHVVSEGETLYGISRKYDIAITELAAWNNLDAQHNIKPGQELVLIAKAPENKVVGTTKSVEIIHEVKNSDTLYGVARKYGVTIKELMDWNDKKDFGITVGEKLKIYTTE